MYDLEQRTFLFSSNLISICNKLPSNIITNPLVSQVVRSGTSIGANYCEANGSISKKDFRYKIFICKKESKETVYWLKLLLTIYVYSKDLQSLLDEADQLARIFNKISLSTPPEVSKF